MGLDGLVNCSFLKPIREWMRDENLFMAKSGGGECCGYLTTSDKSFSAAMLAASWREIKNQFLKAFTQFEISVGEAVCFINLIKALPTMAPAPYWQAAAKVEAFEIPKPNIMGFFKPMRCSRSK